MTAVKIIGAGSIGNHLAHAARRKGWQVTITDIDEAALDRTKTLIHPGRYGAWDEAITLVTNDQAPRGGFDYIFIGTPPDSHVSLARAAVAEKPKAVLVEKPLSGPDLAGCQELYDEAKAAGVRVFTGYDHVVAKSIASVATQAQNLGPVETLDVSFREHWRGIFNAHPWLDGPADTYLGYWRRGGGALGEHSHAVNMWQHLAHEIGAGRVTAVTAVIDYVTRGKAEYDRLAHLTLETESGLIGHVIQDVVSLPTLKWARVQGDGRALEWQVRPQPYADIVRILSGGEPIETVFDKTRPDDFIQELDHIEAAMANGTASPLSIERGLDTMMVIAAGHLSAQKKRRVVIDHARGFRLEALSCASAV